MFAKVLSRISSVGLMAFTFASLISCRDSVLQPIAEHNATATPEATLTAVTYAGGNLAINSAATVTLTATFSHAHSTTWIAGTGSSSAPPTGVSVTAHGTATCSQVDVSSLTTAGATITVAGCTGNGSIDIQVDAGLVDNEDGQHNTASTARTIAIDNATPTATIAVTNPAVGSATGANVATATFNELVTALSATNANGEFTITGCSTSPAVAIAMSVNGSGNSVATATLSGGTCADLATVTVTLHLNTVNDRASNAGLVGNNPTPPTYTVDLVAPTLSLASATYPSTTTALSSSGSSVVAITFTHASTKTIVNASGTTSAPPTGLVVGTSGVSCSSVVLSAVTLSGATVTVSGCSGDGTVSVGVGAGVLASSGGLTNAASGTQTIEVQTTAPTITTSTLGAATSPASGNNTLTITFDQMIQTLSTTNANGVIQISGDCATPPSVAIANSSSSGHSIATITLTGATCTLGDLVHIDVDNTKILNRAGVALSTAPATKTYDVGP